MVFINVGGNDLIMKKIPQHIFDHSVRLVAKLQQASVNDIYLAEILSNGDFSKCPDPAMNKIKFN